MLASNQSLDCVRFGTELSWRFSSAGREMEVTQLQGTSKICRAGEAWRQNVTYVMWDSAKARSSG